jgi:hypothetical protein
MSTSPGEHQILIVTGASLRAERMDRPLAYRLAREIRKRLGRKSEWQVTVITDVLYLHDESLADCPLISIGGPGVNCLSSKLFRELPSVLAVDHALIIQMDVEMKDHRCCLWGMDHEQTVEALDHFCRLGHLDTFLAGFTTART